MTFTENGREMEGELVAYFASDFWRILKRSG
jgi:hypothetical protein